MINKELARKVLRGEMTAEEYHKQVDGAVASQNCTSPQCNCEGQQAPTTPQQPTMQMFNFVQGRQAPTYVSGNVHLDNLFGICTSQYMVEQSIVAANELLAVMQDMGVDAAKVSEVSGVLNQIINIIKNPAASRAVAKALGVEFGFIDPATVSPDDPDLAILKDMSESIAKLFNDGKATNKNVA